MQNNKEITVAADIRKTDLSFHDGINFSHRDKSEYFDIAHEVTTLHYLLES